MEQECFVQAMVNAKQLGEALGLAQVRHEALCQKRVFNKSADGRCMKMLIQQMFYQNHRDQRLGSDGQG